MESAEKKELLRVSDEILNYLLSFKEKNPDFTFSIRRKDSVQSKEVRLEKGQWFQGSSYIYVPLFRRGDSARKIKTIGFEISFNKDGSLKNNFLEVSFKKGNYSDNEIKFHKELATSLDLQLSEKNHGIKHYPKRENYLENLQDYITRVRSLAINGIKKYDLSDLYIIAEDDFQKRLRIVQGIRQKISNAHLKEELVSDVFLDQAKKIKHPYNQILFGPPGTGKTYNCINHALKIINEKEEQNVDWNNRDLVKSVFDKRVSEGRIVFTTFHQSMSYEDFIEGLKPKYNENKQVIEYPTVPGIFKSVCYAALKDTYYSNIEQAGENEIDFDIVFNEFVEELKRNFKDDDYPFKTKGNSELRLDKDELNNNQIVVYYRWSNASAKTGAGKTPFPIKKEKLKRMFDENVSANESNLKKRLKTILSYHLSPYYAVYKTFLPFLNEKIKTTSSISPDTEFESFESEEDFSKYLEQLQLLHKKNKELKKGKPFVLIIDEINRGNISQIFGELITLIEEDKRIGNPEALEVTLPYSKEKFGVPSNLYIIGTMNTADRSVEALDTALRRRFSFWEMPPVYELEQLEYEYDAGITASSILETINKRIEKLLNKDHLIGHSFFILREGEKPEEKVPIVFYENIIPLLQEYFFGDYAKLGMVLGKGFINKKEWTKGEDSFADFDVEIEGDFDEKEVYEIIDYRDEDSEYSIVINKKLIEMDFPKAIKLLMKQPID